MPVITATQVIERPIDEVFSTVADAATFHRWNPTITSARKLSDGEPRLGSRFEWNLRGFGTVVQEFGEFERHKRIRIVPHMNGLRGGHRFTFSMQGNATRIEHELEMLPTGWFRLFGPVLGLIGRRNLRDTTQALQKYLEAR
jgi:polyketide cyclase/dehydrase/lipid transport protein